jgi:hypothetical protein
LVVEQPQETETGFLFYLLFYLICGLDKQITKFSKFCQAKILHAMNSYFKLSRFVGSGKKMHGISCAPFSPSIFFFYSYIQINFSNLISFKTTCEFFFSFVFCVMGIIYSLSSAFYQNLFASSSGYHHLYPRNYRKKLLISIGGTLRNKIFPEFVEICSFPLYFVFFFFILDRLVET